MIALSVKLREWKPGEFPNLLSSCGAERLPDKVIPQLRIVRALARDEAVLDRLRAHPDVEWVERERSDAKIAATYYAGATDPKLDDAWAFKRINLYRAQKYATGNPSIRVCVLDTGLPRHGHEDLPAIAAGDGYNFATDAANPFLVYPYTETDPELRNWDNANVHHGSWCASLIWAQRGDGVGLCGVAPGVTPMFGAIGIYVPESQGFALLPSADQAEAIVWAADGGARVISCSWGNAITDSPAEVTAAVAYAIGLGAIVVGAAGNESYWKTRGAAIPPPPPPLVRGTNNYKSHVAYLDGVVCAGAIEEDDYVSKWPPEYMTRSAAPNTGPGADILAPGSCVLAAGFTNEYGLELLGDVPEAGYYFVNGTSFSCPLTAGVLSLILSVNPSLTAAQAKAILFASTDDFHPPTGDGAFYYPNAKVLNAAKSVLSAMTTVPDNAGAVYPLAQFWRSVVQYPPEAIGEPGIPAGGAFSHMEVSGGAVTTTLDGDFDVELQGYSSDPVLSVALEIDGVTVYDGPPGSVLHVSATYDGSTAVPVTVIARTANATTAETYDDVRVTSLVVNSITYKDPLASFSVPVTIPAGTHTLTLRAAGGV